MKLSTSTLRGETTYTLNSCFINNADINKDGVVNSVDIDRLAELILEQTNCQNNQNFRCHEENYCNFFHGNFIVFTLLSIV